MDSKNHPQNAALFLELDGLQREGLITAAERRELAECAARQACLPGDLLLRGDVISQATLTRIRRDLAHNMTKKPGLEKSGHTAKSARASFCKAIAARYRVIRPLGKGGTGEVLLAEDNILARKVAIKHLHCQDPEQLARFAREARAQARAEHPHICKIFAVEETGGNPFIVMQYIEGQSLDQAARQMSLEEKVLVFEKVAHAIHHANRVGLIHRDLKPGNILVAKNSDGSHHPYVLDFGLARHSDQPEITADGMLMGTPAFMAPEQARGESQLDRRTDVYGLGATLYCILSGNPPFQSQSLATLLSQIQFRDPQKIRLSHPEIPQDVETIVCQCLAKKRDQRYASAQALAGDLTRFLNGDPISAHSASFWHRLRKRVAKDKRFLSLAAIAACLLLLSIGWGLRTAWRASVRERLALNLSGRVQEIEAFTRQAYLAPAHNLQPDFAHLHGLMETMEQDINQAGSLGRGLGLYALGRGHLILGNLEKAQTMLEAASGSGYQVRRVNQALALTYSGLYRRELAALGLIADRPARQAKRKVLEDSLGRKSRQAIRLARQNQNDTPHYLNALLAFCEGQFQEALNMTGAAQDNHAWFYESHKLAGDIHFEIGRQFWEAGQSQSALQSYSNALKAIGKAGQIARSDPEIPKAAKRVIIATMSLKMFDRNDLPAYLQKGLNHAAHALALNPEDGETWLLKARLLRRMAQYLHFKESSPESILAEAEHAALAAKAIGAQDGPDAEFELASIYWRWARWLIDRQQHPGKRLAQASSALALVRPQNRDYIYYQMAGQIYKSQVKAQNNLSGNVCHAANLAIEAFEKTVILRPESIQGYSSLGTMLRQRAQLQQCGGTPAGVWLEAAAHNIEKAIAIHPEHWVLHYQLGRTLLSWAQNGDLQNGSLDPVLAVCALEHYETGLALEPKNTHHLYNAMGSVYQALYRQAWERGERGQAYFNEAVRAYRTCLEFSPHSSRFLQNLAWMHYYRGKFHIRAGLDPAEDLVTARALASKAAKGSESLLCLASIDRMLAEEAQDRNTNPLPFLQRSRDGFLKILARNGSDVEALRSLGRLHTLWAQVLVQIGEDPRPQLELAKSPLHHALALWPNSPYVQMASARRYLFEYRSSNNPASRAAGLSAAEKALALRPDLPEAKALVVAFSEAKMIAKNRSGLPSKIDTVVQQNQFLKHEFLVRPRKTWGRNF